MNDESAFLAAIAADPKDELGYLVFADWLQEQGEEVRAGLVRDPEARAHLGPTLTDPFPDLRTHLMSRTRPGLTQQRAVALGASAVPTLAAVLSESSDPVVWAGVAGCARSIGPPARGLLPVLLPLLPPPPGRQPTGLNRSVLEAVRAIGLGEIAESEEGEPLYLALCDPDTQLHESVAAVLGPDRMGGRILSRLDRDRADPDPELRLGAARGLAQCPEDISAWRLLEMLGDSDAVVRIQAVESLKCFSGSGVVPGLLHALGDPDGRVRRAVADYWNLARPDRGALVSALRRSLADPDPDVVLRVAYLLCSIGPDAAAALPELEACLPRTEQMIWSAFAWAMQRIDPTGEAALRAVRNRLDDPDPIRYVEALIHLESVATPDATLIPGLTRVLSHPDAEQFHRAHALRCLGRIHPPSPQTLDLFRDYLRREPMLRDAELAAFRSLGAQALPLLPALEARARGRDAGCVGAAIAAVGPEGIELLARLLDEFRDEPRMISPLVRGLDEFGLSIAPLVSRLAALLPTIPPSWTCTEIVRAILAAGPLTTIALDALLLHLTTHADPRRFVWYIASSPEALPLWRAGVSLAASNHSRMCLTRVVLESTRQLKPFPAAYLLFVGEAIAAARAVARAAAEGSPDERDAGQALTWACRVAAKQGRAAAHLAAAIAAILADPVAARTAGLERAAAYALGRLGDRAQAPALLPLLRHAQEPVAAQAARSLGLLRSPGAVAALLGATWDHRPRVRLDAVGALGRTGVATPEVLDRLADLMDDDAPIRRCASLARVILAGRASRAARLPPSGGSP